MFDDSSLPNRSPSLPFSLSNSYEPLPSEPNDMQHNHHPINLSMEVSGQMKPLNSNNCNPQKRLSDMMAKKSENSIDIYYTIYQEFFLHAENPSDLLKQVIEFPGNVGDDSLAPQK